MLNPQRLLAGALALIGLILLIVGGWFAVKVGPDGAVTFQAEPGGKAPLVLEPSLLNGTDRALTVTITPAQGDTVWSALGSPSDANAVIAQTPVQRFSGVTTSGWTLQHATVGTGSFAALASADVWREPMRTQGPVTYTIDQSQAPEVLVANGTTAALESVEVTYTHRTWFFQALVAAIVGLLFIGIGGFTVWSGLKPAEDGASSDPVSSQAAPAASAETPAVETPVAETPVADTPVAETPEADTAPATQEVAK